MTAPLTPRHLRQIADFAACSCPCSQPNMERARGHLNELLSAFEDSLALNLRLLPVEEYKQRDPLEADTVRATIRRQEELLEALGEARAR